ncbi:MAG: glycosyltransferase family 39 protein [Verrucomicrobiae bacterium]|nr:glycosyltransferase family 39 protein [Verrucomicrobiae bacterium]
MKSRLLPLIWRRPHGRTEWVFTAVLALMFASGLAWIIAQGAEGTANLKEWFAVLGGKIDSRMKTPQYLDGGLLLSAWAWLIAAAMLWLTRFWWWKKRDTRIDRGAVRKIVDKPFLLGVGALLLLALVVRWPRMELSLYNDEIDVFRTSIEGSFRGEKFQDIQDDSLPEFRHIRWIETIWGNRIGNNHQLHSILARLTYDLWHALDGKPEGTIEEWPLRLPPLVLGLVSIAAIAALGRIATGSLRAGLFAALFLALHPWHLRYSTEARGYGMVFGLGILTVLFLILAVQRGQWRWWLAFAIAQMTTLWACIGALHLLVAINLVAGIAFLWPRRDPASGARLNPLQSPTLPCWIVATVFSACLYLPMAASALPPLRLAIETNAVFSRGVVAHWWPNLVSYYLVGMPWHDADPESLVNPAMAKYLGNPLVIGGLMLAVALTLTGIWRLLRRGDFIGWLLAIAPIYGVFELWLTSKLGGSTALVWYGNFSLPFQGLWMGIGLYSWIYRSSERTSQEPVRRPELGRKMVTYALILLWAAAIARPLVSYQMHGKQNLKGAIALIRGGVFPLTEEQRVPLVASWWTHANFYDPYLRIVHSSEGLDAMIDRANREGRPLYFVLGAREIASSEKTGVVKRLEDPTEFENVAILPGLEENQFRIWVYQYRGVRKS